MGWVLAEIISTQKARGGGCCGSGGRAAIVAFSREALSFLPYTELINKEAEVIGVSDHLASELPSLMRYVQRGKLTFPESALCFVDLDAAQNLS